LLKCVVILVYVEKLFIRWKRAYESHGEDGIVNNKACPENYKLRIPQPIEEKIIHLRKTYHFGPDMIMWH